MAKTKHSLAPHDDELDWLATILLPVAVLQSRTQRIAVEGTTQATIARHQYDTDAPHFASLEEWMEDYFVTSVRSRLGCNLANELAHLRGVGPRRKHALLGTPQPRDGNEFHRLRDLSDIAH